jgi:hypothetical protein
MAAAQRDKNMKSKLTLLVVTGALFASQAASAGFIRCGSHVIEDGGRAGTGKYEVLRKCGEPTVRYGNTWIYERGGVKKVIRFHDSGQVSTISDG